MKALYFLSTNTINHQLLTVLSLLEVEKKLQVICD